MVDQRLLDYIRDNVSKGYSIHSLRNMLISRGWDSGQVDEAISMARTPVPAQPQLPPPAGQPQQAPPPQAQPPPPPQQIPQQPPAQQAPQAPQQAGPPPQPSTPPSRPKGVTIICILGFLAAILLLVAGIFSVFLGEFFAGFEPLTYDVGNQTILSDLEGFEVLVSMLSFMGYIFIVIALIDFVALYLLLKMKKTGWILVTLMEIITIILGVMVLSMTNILGIVLAIVIVIYLFTKRKIFV